jgi:hypothetical protein
MVADLSGDAGMPDPTELSTAAKFVDAMRRLKLWTGWGYRRLEKRAVAAGQSLPRSTLTVALARATLPREDLVEAFVRACGCDDDQTARWIAARRRIAGATSPAHQPEVTDPPAGSRRGSRVGWPIRTAAVLLVLAMAATTAWVVLGARRGDLSGQLGQDQAAPAQPDRGRHQPVPPTGSTTATPTTSTPPGPAPGQPADPATTKTGPILPVNFPVASPPAPNLPLPGVSIDPTVTVPPAAPAPATKEAIRLPDDRTIQCPMPYLSTMYGPVAVCTLRSGDQATIGYYSPFTQDFGPFMEGLHVQKPTWYEREILGTDGISATARGYATVETMYGPAVWATQYQQGRARWGVINLITDRFQPDDVGWLDAG